MNWNIYQFEIHSSWWPQSSQVTRYQFQFCLYGHVFIVSVKVSRWKYIILQGKLFNQYVLFISVSFIFPFCQYQLHYRHGPRSPLLCGFSSLSFRIQWMHMTAIIHVCNSNMWLFPSYHLSFWITRDRQCNLPTLTQASREKKKYRGSLDLRPMLRAYSACQFQPREILARISSPRIQMAEFVVSWSAIGERWWVESSKAEWRLSHK